MRAFFNSDNYAPVLPEVMAALAAANEGHAPAYGADAVTARVEARLREELGEDAEPEDAYELVTARMQDTLSGLAEDRTIPVVG